MYAHKHSCAISQTPFTLLSHQSTHKHKYSYGYFTNFLHTFIHQIPYTRFNIRTLIIHKFLLHFYSQITCTICTTHVYIHICLIYCFQVNKASIHMIYKETKKEYPCPEKMEKKTIHTNSHTYKNERNKLRK